MFGVRSRIYEETYALRSYAYSGEFNCAIINQKLFYNITIITSMIQGHLRDTIVVNQPRLNCEGDSGENRNTFIIENGQEEVIPKVSFEIWIVDLMSMFF